MGIENDIDLAKDLVRTKYISQIEFIRLMNEWLSMTRDKALSDAVDELIGSYWHDGTDEDIAKLKSCVEKLKAAIKKAKIG